MKRLNFNEWYKKDISVKDLLNKERLNYYDIENWLINISDKTRAYNDIKNNENLDNKTLNSRLNEILSELENFKQLIAKHRKENKIINYVNDLDKKEWIDELYRDFLRDFDYLFMNLIWKQDYKDYKKQEKFENKIYFRVKKLIGEIIKEL